MSTLLFLLCYLKNFLRGMETSTSPDVMLLAVLASKTSLEGWKLTIDEHRVLLHEVLKNFLRGMETYSRFPACYFACGLKNFLRGMETRRVVIMATRSGALKNFLRGMETHSRPLMRRCCPPLKNFLRGMETAIAAARLGTDHLPQKLP